MAPSTRAAYITGFNCYRRFCTLKPVPADVIPSESHLEEFVAFCAGNNLTFSTIKLYLCAVRHECILLGHGDVISNKPRLDLTLRGVKKVCSKPKATRLPITTPVMYDLHRTLAGGVHDAFTDVMLFAVMNVAFFGALRCSEFCVTSVFDPNSNLTHSDIEFGYDAKIVKHFFSLTLKASKTDPFREGITLVLYETGQVLCPVQSLKAYLSLLSNPGALSPMFCLCNGQPLTRSVFLKLLHVALDKAGYHCKNYNTHSFRKGFTTSASAALVPDHIISALGRWRSQCYKLYISTPRSVIAQAQQSLSLLSLCNKV